MCKYIILCLSCALSVMSCFGQKVELTESGANFFGEKISAQDAIHLQDAKMPVNASDTVEIALKGIVNEVCQAKGCWMTFESMDKDKSVFVRFKDYGFFVPKNAGGKDAIIKGKLFSTITSVDELRHYAEDKGKSKEEIAAITEPSQEIRMTAEGVIIYNE